MDILSASIGNWETAGDGSWTQVSRFPPDARLHIPAEDGRIVHDATFPDGSPTWGGRLRVSCIAVELGGATRQLSVREPGKSYVLAQVERRGNAFVLELTWRPAAYAPRLGTDGPPRQIVREHGDPASVWRDYRRWMDQVWPRQPTFTPNWVRQMPSAVYVELWTGSGTITHTFGDLVALLKKMAGAGVPKDCLLYFWGFHAPFDTAYPNYRPADELGGADGMAALVDTAHCLGYRLMPHLNYWGCDGRLPIFERFRHAQVKDRNGKPQGWRTEGEPPIEYIRPSCQEWRDLMADVCGRLVESFPVDALFLDQLGSFPDDPGCDFDAATQAYVEQIQAACPGVALGGEVFHERCRSLPIWQVWGTPWCGLPVREDLEHATMWRELFSDQLTMVAHMGTPGPVQVRDSWPAYYWYPEHYGLAEATRRANHWHRAIGAVPCVRVNFREFGLDEVAIEILAGRTGARQSSP